MNLEYTVLGSKKLKNMKPILRFSLSIFIVAFPLLLFGQQGVVTATGDMIGEQGSISYSAGQTDYLFLKSENYSLLFGLQQPFKVAPVNIDDLDDLADSYFRLYPNPTDGKVTLEIINENPNEKVVAEIFGMHGGLIERREIMNSSQQVFNLQGQQPGVYLFRVIQGTQTFVKRLIKK